MIMTKRAEPTDPAVRPAPADAITTKSKAAMTSARGSGLNDRSDSSIGTMPSGPLSAASAESTCGIRCILIGPVRPVVTKHLECHTDQAEKQTEIEEGGSLQERQRQVLRRERVLVVVGQVAVTRGHNCH